LHRRSHGNLSGGMYPLGGGLKKFCFKPTYQNNTASNFIITTIFNNILCAICGELIIQTYVAFYNTFLVIRAQIFP
jgi:hypothetical protein